MKYFEKNQNFTAGFTLTELLVVISIMAIISGMFISYGRGSQKELLLYKEQQKVASMLQKARDLSLSAYGGDNVPCGYGVHLEPPNTIVVFKSTPVASNQKCLILNQIVKIYNTAANDINQPCGSMLNSECIQKIYLDDGVTFDAANQLSDIIFIPPEPLVYVNNNDNLYEADVFLKNDFGKKKIKVTKAGQVTVCRKTGAGECN